MTELTFGVTVPQWNEHAGPDVWRQIAETAEQLRFDVLWKGDHVTFPEKLPGGGVSGSGPTTNTYDLFETLSFLAGTTDDIHIGSNVCVVPYRHPVLLAKNVLSLDALAGGRFEFGVGAGWLEAEFGVLDVPYEERSGRTSEFLELFARIVEDGEIAFDGEYHSFQRTGFYPRPSDSDGPSVWVGGDSSAALRRLAKYGDGWTVVGKTPAELKAGRNRAIAAWSDFDRNDDPEIAVTQNVHVGSDPGVDSPLAGPVDDVIDGITAYIDVGVTHLNIRLRGKDTEERVRQFERFAERVRPSF